MATSNRISRRSLLENVAIGAAGTLAAAEMVRTAGAAETGRGGRIKQSICKWCYRNMTVDQLAGHAARLGYKSVELLAPKDWATVRKHGLTCAMCTGTGPITIGSCLNRRENHSAVVAELRKNIELAADAGVPNVICFSGNRKGQPDDVGLEICAEGLKKVVGLAEKKKVNVCMEILNSRVNHKDYQCDKSAWGIELCKRVGSPRFGLLNDIYHVQIMEGDIIRTIRDHHQYFFHYHTGGNPGRNEIDDTQELNYAAIMRAIVDTGYQGYVGQEFIPKRDPGASLAQAFQICDV